jgi:hypothetical protein
MQYFQPEPIFKGLPLARALRDLGHEVEVLTGFPNYPGGKILGIPPKAVPTGNLGWDPSDTCASLSESQS